MNYDINHSYLVNYFEIVTFGGNGKPEIQESHSDKLIDQQIDQLEKLSIGDKLYIENAIVSYNSGEEIQVRIAIFEIK